MNDFTKEEIIWLYEDIGCDLEEYQQPDIAYRIHEKLKKMVDNYCEHKTHVIFSGDMLICDNCKERI
jgi:hypothetical protein